MNSNIAAENKVELDLLRRSADGDQDAFHKLYKLTCRKAYGYLCRLLSVRGVADAALAETYTEVWKAAPHFKGTMKVSTWILCAARAVAVRKLSQPKIKNLIENQILSRATQNSSAGTLDRQRLLYQAINTLPLNQKEILALALLPKISYEEIAKILRIPVTTAKMKTTQAKAAFQQNLAKIGASR